MAAASGQGGQQVMAWIQTLEYVVERDAAHWTVSLQGEHCGCFASRRVALESALRDAERVRGLGHAVRVFVRHADGRLRCLPTALHPRSHPACERPPGWASPER
jgi:hypothetical protein